MSSPQKKGSNGMSPSPTSVIVHPNAGPPFITPSFTWKSGKRFGWSQGYSCGLNPGKRDWPT